MGGRRQDGDDDGFTLVEIIVSLGLITVVMTALSVFMINSRAAGRYASLRNTAVQLTLEGMEKARAVRGSALLSGRAQCAGGCAAVVAPRVAALLGAGTTRWDATAAGTLTLPQAGTQPDGSVITSPADPEVALLDGRTFKRYYYVGSCWQAAVLTSATNITCGTTTASATLVRLVVAVTWNDKQCEDGNCSYAESALFGTAITDPFITG